jgi:uncharacterized surface protein with fasciclin (FAS1) repeats
MGFLSLALVVVVAAGCDDDKGSKGTGGGATGGAATGGAATGGSVATGGGPGGAAPKDIVDTAVAAGSFTKLASALTAADLVTTLKGPGPFTVFAPTDAAFAKLPAGTLDNLLKPENKTALIDVLTYHVVSGKVSASDVVKLSHATTVEKQDVAIVVSGAKVTVNDATVTTTDIAAANGIIHVIDTVLLPPAKDIVDTAVAAGSFTKLAAALTAGDLASTLKGAGPFTVFAPTDAAFAKLPAGTLDNLLKPENKAMLQAVLKYHVVSGKVYAGDVVTLSRATTVGGADISIAVNGGAVKLNTTSTVTQVNVLATNGVIHVIDTVLLPPG